MIYNSVSNLIVASISQKGEQRLLFRLLFVNLQRGQDDIHVFDAKYKYVLVV